LQYFESIRDSQLIEDCMWLLQKFLGKQLPRPINMQRTKWMSNENFIGTYSYTSMNAAAAGIGFGDLAEPLKNTNGKPVLLFAGEATDETYPSYAHGAVSSGWREGRRIVNHYKK